MNEELKNDNGVKYARQSGGHDYYEFGQSSERSRKGVQMAKAMGGTVTAQAAPREYSSGQIPDEVSAKPVKYNWLPKHIDEKLLEAKRAIEDGRVISLEDFVEEIRGEYDIPIETFGVILDRYERSVGTDSR
jgi:hypothetical protein